VQVNTEIRPIATVFNIIRWFLTLRNRSLAQVSLAGWLGARSDWPRVLLGALCMRFISLQHPANALWP
jgi:hypothetical protein